jgi:hypothetical protein
MNDGSKYTIHNMVRFGFQLARGTIAAAERWCYRNGLLERDALHFPDFLCIGAQKAGTTWLYKNLRHHPGIQLTQPKELHYFDRYFHESLDSYSRHFEQEDFAVREKVTGEITPAYCFIPVRRIQFIHDMRPDLRLIFLMRNPVERAWSHAVMNLVEHSDRRFEDIPDEDFFAHYRSEGAVERGDYLATLDNWLSVYPRKQLYIGFLEDLAQRPQQLLTDVFEHIGVTTEVDWASFPYNRKIRTAEKPAMPQAHRRFLQAMYREDIQQLAERFAGPPQQWLDDLPPPS